MKIEKRTKREEHGDENEENIARIKIGQQKKR